MSESTTYLTADEAREYLRFKTIRALYRWASANAIPKCRRGRSMLFLRRDLDEAVGNSRGARRRSHASQSDAPMRSNPVNGVERDAR